MSSSASRSGERMIHQDFIARIRYSNALPPPPNPPKLLDIPNTGLASGQYTTPGFASRLAREQPLNIEADAELGMPLDLVGMPGVFDGDESSIQAPAHTPQVHPHDRALLKPLSTLGKPRTSDAAVSFLRRTEYISSVPIKHRQEGSALLLRPGTGNTVKRPEKRKSPEPDAGTPAYVKRKIEKSFEAVQQDRSRVRHPTKKNLRLVEALPVLPDLDAFPDSGAYVTVKFTNNPVAGTNSGSGSGSGTYDTRLLSGIFKPIERSAAEEAAYEAAVQAHELDPERNPRPSNTMNYEFYLPDTATTSERFRNKFDLDNPDRDDEALYTARDSSGDSQSGGGVFHFQRVRAYETGEEKELTHETKYDEEIILAQTADGTVLYYPVMQRSTVRSQRTRNIARTTGLMLLPPGAPGSDEDEQIVDQLDVTVSDPTPEMRDHVARIRADPLHFDNEDEDQEAQQPAASSQNGGGRNGGEKEEEEEGDEGNEDETGGAPPPQRNGTSAHDDSDEGPGGATTNGRGRHAAEESDEQDAEGDEEDDEE